MRKKLQRILILLLVFFGVSIGVRYDIGKDHKRVELPFSVDVSLLTPLKANADSWGFVRGSASWARGNSLFMDDLIFNIQRVFPVGTSLDLTTSIPINGMMFTVRVILNDPSSKIQPITPTTLTTTVLYPNYFGLTDPNGQPALQFYFSDNPRTDSLKRGAVMYYRLDRLNPFFETGKTALIESYVVDPTSTPKDPLLIQTYSWAGALGTDAVGQKIKGGRVILEEMDNGALFCFKAVVRLGGDANILPVFPNEALCPPGTADEYYKLAYSQQLTGDLNVTAKSGWEEGAITPNDAVICPASVIAQNLNYGLFNFFGFVNDHVASTAIPADFPAASRVDGLYARIGTLGKTGGDGTTTAPASSVWDDTQKGTIDGLSAALAAFPTPPNP
ncbi:LIC_12337 family protein [Leptospira perolatii]|uniref:LIC_12337 family protein n=1 Tax=Leptospira perolatii TaxID=2023191 RepID=UPI001A9C4A29|nr:hypothetical protein [Leptospira perolatii]